MRIPSAVQKTLAVLAAGALVFTVYFSYVRPWFLRWGATDLEVSERLPGDELVSALLPRTTRAITIAAPAEAVWPWLAQIGQDRAGFYSYEILEDLVGAEMPRANRIVPEYQDWRPGDRLWMYPPEKGQGKGNAPLAVFESGRDLVFSTLATDADIGDGIWGFHLEPIGENTTRLIVRGCGSLGAGALANTITLGFYEPAHYVMERRMMLEIRSLAEGRGATPRAAEILEVSLWTLTVVLLVVALVQVARRRRWGRPLGMAVAAALVFQVLTLLQPPPVLGTLLVIALVLGLGWAPPVEGWRRAALPRTARMAHA